MPNDFLIFQRFFWPLHFFGLPLHRKSGNTVSILYFDSVAQLVEQMTLNHWVESSSLSGVTRPNGKIKQIAETKTVSAIFVMSYSAE